MSYINPNYFWLKVGLFVMSVKKKDLTLKKKSKEYEPLIARLKAWYLASIPTEKLKVGKHDNEILRRYNLDQAERKKNFEASKALRQLKFNARMYAVNKRKTLFQWLKEKLKGGD